MKQLLIGAVIGALGAYLYLQANPHIVPTNPPTEEEKIAAYYANSTATLVSPHNIRERMTHSEDDFILVDTRAEEDYLREHVVTAINIDSSQPTEDIIAAFLELTDRAETENKEVIIYCYSVACMNGRKLGNLLAENDIFVKELTIGWNEWRYGWQTWNYDTEWNTYKVEDFVATGAEPGVVPDSAKSFKACGIEGELGC